MCKVFLEHPVVKLAHERTNDCEDEVWKPIFMCPLKCVLFCGKENLKIR